MEKRLDKKYAKAWCLTNSWQTPNWLVPSRLDQPITKKEKHLFISGAWKVLDELLRDGVISEAQVNDVWTKMIGRKSNIKVIANV